MLQKVPTFHSGCLASTVRQTDIWKKKKRETKQWFQCDRSNKFKSTVKKYSDRLKNPKGVSQLTWWAPRAGCLVLRSRIWLSCEGSRVGQLENRAKQKLRGCRNVSQNRPKRSFQSTHHLAETQDFVNLLLTCFLMLFVTSSQCCNETNVTKSISMDVEKMVESD